MQEKELNPEVEFHPEARLELGESAEWYEEKKSGLGELFIDEIEEKLNQILKHPYSYSEVHKKARQTSLKKFPYFVYYVIQSKIIYIIAIWHKKRNREDWKDRL